MEDKELTTDSETVLKRTIKDSVFTDLFGMPKYLIKLYRALHPEDKTTEVKDITDVTIKNILTDAPYNDLGFRIGNTLLLLMEAQSTWSVNIVIRMLMYLMQTYNDYCTTNGIDLYRSKKAELPRPELYVLFTGERKNKPEFISFKDEFFPDQDIAMETRVKVIYDGQPGDIINQYVRFTKVANDQIKKYGRTKKAIEETIRICKNEDVLTEYLKEREVEVMDIMTALFNEEEISRRHDLSVQKDKAESIAKKMITNGKMSYEEIAECAGLTLEEVEKLANIELV